MTDGQKDKDIETLLTFIYESGEWDFDTHDDILARWRLSRGEDGKCEWSWWAKHIDDENFAIEAPRNKNTRDGAIEMAFVKIHDDYDELEVIEARRWSDKMHHDEMPAFAETRNHQIVNIRVRTVQERKI